ncbi:MAG TPA: DUF1570 domain-containing protein [Verrucomicrobiota bacterium]|nr:DUF1570 domain-containing protein [Verrucomicrobiota bacterium]
MKAACILIFALWLASPALAATNAPVLQGDGVCRFILHDYPLTKTNEAVINFVVTDLLKRHERAFDFNARTNLRVVIRIFGRFDDFRDHIRSNSDGFGELPSSMEITNLAGVYSIRDREVVTWRQHDPAYFANNLLHECSHAIMNQQFRVLPLWVMEGTAEFFSFPQYMRDAKDQRRLMGRWLQLKESLDNGSLPRLEEFLKTSDTEFRAMKPEQSYLASWSLIQFFQSNAANRKALNDMIRALQRPDVTLADCPKLLARGYAGGLAKMEKDWHAWITRGAASVLQSLQKPKTQQPGTR